MCMIIVRDLFVFKLIWSSIDKGVCKRFSTASKVCQLLKIAKLSEVRRISRMMTPSKSYESCSPGFLFVHTSGVTSPVFKTVLTSSCPRRFEPCHTLERNLMIRPFRGKVFFKYKEVPLMIYPHPPTPPPPGPPSVYCQTSNFHMTVKRKFSCYSPLGKHFSVLYPLKIQFAFMLFCLSTTYLLGLFFILTNFIILDDILNILNLIGHDLTKVVSNLFIM